MPTTIHDDDHRRLVAMLKELRQRSGLKQAEVADLLGVPQSFVSKYETGERRLDLLEVRRICKVLGTTLTDFVQRFEDSR